MHMTFVKLPLKRKRVICIIANEKSAYSETFIRSHVEHLPAVTHLVYGRHICGLPAYYGDGYSIFTGSVTTRVLQSIVRRMARLPRFYFDELAFKRFLLRRKVDVVLAEYGVNGVAVMNICINARIPLIVHFHGYDAYMQDVLDGPGKLYSELFRKAAAIVVVSKHMECQLLRLGAPPDKLYNNPYGVDVEFFQQGRPEESDILFISVGRFVDKKAPHLTILAFAQVLSVFPSARLQMIGDGILLEVCRSLSRSLGIQNSVDFLGVQPQEKIAEAMRQARAFVQHSIKTSYGDSEGTPVSILEASAVGLPVISTRHCGIEDVVVDGKTGFLVDEYDIDGMAQRMIDVIRSPQLAAKLGKAARDRVVMEFSMDKSIERLWGIVESGLRK